MLSRRDEVERVPRTGQVVVRAFDKDEREILQDALTYDEYFDDIHPIYDNLPELSRRGITTLEFEIWNKQGELEQVCENYYEADGTRVGGRTTFPKSGPVVDE